MSSFTRAVSRAALKRMVRDRQTLGNAHALLHLLGKPGVAEDVDKVITELTAKIDAGYAALKEGN